MGMCYWEDCEMLHVSWRVIPLSRLLDHTPSWKLWSWIKRISQRPLILEFNKSHLEFVVLNSPQVQTPSWCLSLCHIMLPQVVTPPVSEMWQRTQASWGWRSSRTESLILKFILDWQSTFISQCSCTHYSFITSFISWGPTTHRDKLSGDRQVIILLHVHIDTTG